jgi:hypothetical protein
MPLTMHQRWECDGCGVVVVTPERGQPQGWVHVQASAISQDARLQSQFVYFLCPSCWTGSPWIAENTVKPMPPNPSPAHVRPTDEGVTELRWPTADMVECGACGGAIAKGSTTCPHCFASDADE